eukprot:TRINITY_DN5436_c0_g1_i1.p1 TRINITY_DN5436_c0_g1~~TRINITY_DN5436_c0_g1_i1.p1  ORF type:complete len:435 (+),score=26.49 TRINITY_DN5436_c0_g1_i1:104-1306(+)
MMPPLPSVKRWRGLPASLGVNVTRNKHTAVEYDGKMYVFGGHDLEENSFLGDLLCYDVEKKTWIDLNVKGRGPCPRRAHSAEVIDGRMVVFGGFQGDCCQADTYSLDLSTIEWSKLEGKGPCARGGHSSSKNGEKLYIFGGWDTNLTYHSDVWQASFDFEKKQIRWSEIEPKTPNAKSAPHGRVGHRSVIHDQKMIVHGGYGGEQYWNDTIVFDLATREWSEKSNPENKELPSARTYHSMVASDAGKIAIVGGSDEDGMRTDVWILDTKTWKWTNLDCDGIGRFAHTCVASGSGAELIIFGGTNVPETGTDTYSLVIEDWRPDVSLYHSLLRTFATSASLSRIPYLPMHVAGDLSRYMASIDLPPVTPSSITPYPVVSTTPSRPRVDSCVEVSVSTPVVL